MIPNGKSELSVAVETILSQVNKINLSFTTLKLKFILRNTNNAHPIILYNVSGCITGCQIWLVSTSFGLCTGTMVPHLATSG